MATGYANKNGTTVAQGINYKVGTSIRETHQQRTTEDEEMDEDVITENDEPNEWHEVTRTRDRHFMLFAKDEILTGEDQNEKKEELLHILWHMKINVIEGPFHKTTATGNGYKFTVETETEMNKLLSSTVEAKNEEGNPVKHAMFKRLDNTERVLEIERTVEVYGLHPRTHLDRVKSALARFGEIERITTRPCTRGMKITASVVFTSKEAADGIRNSNLASVFVGKDMARIRRIGTDTIEWDKTIVAKLTCLPFGTTPLDLSSLVGTNKASFITIPWAITREGQKSRRVCEAFVYFPSEEAKEQVTKKGVSFGEWKNGEKRQAYWVGLDEKRCYQCGESGHLRMECTVFQKVQETKEHQRAVTRYQKGGPLKVVSERSFSDILRGNKKKDSGENQEKNNKQEKTTQEHKPKEQEQKQEQQHKTTTRDVQHQAIEKKMKSYTDTIVRMEDEMRAMRTQNTALFQLLIALISKTTEIDIAPEIMAAAGFSSDISRNKTGQKSGFRGNALPLNESDRKSVV